MHFDIASDGIMTFIFSSICHFSAVHIKSKLTKYSVR